MIITERDRLKAILDDFKSENKTVVFTNGCFDILHAGHVDYLCKAKELGDILVVALNSDESIKRIKGDKRPVTSENERMYVINNLKPVDIVTIFNEDTPARIIEDIIPNVLVKGADWKIDKIVGAETVLNNGGEVKNIEFTIQQSTTNIINKIFKLYKD